MLPFGNRDMHRFIHDFVVVITYTFGIRYKSLRALVIYTLRVVIYTVRRPW